MSSPSPSKPAAEPEYDVLTDDTLKEKEAVLAFIEHSFARSQKWKAMALQQLDLNPKSHPGTWMMFAQSLNDAFCTLPNHTSDDGFQCTVCNGLGEREDESHCFHCGESLCVKCRGKECPCLGN